MTDTASRPGSPVRRAAALLLACLLAVPLAAAAAAQVRETSPEDPVAHYLERRRAVELYGQEKWEKAEPLLSALARRQPGDSGLWYRLARARRELERPAAAIEAYRRAFGLGYRYGAWIPYQIARLYGDLARPDSALAWLERALATGWGDRPGIASDPAFAFLEGDPRFSRIVPPLPDGLSRAEGWRTDLDYLVAEARRMHAGPGDPALSAEFDAAAASLRDRIPRLSDDQILLEMERLLVQLGDGHTGIYGADPGSPLRFDRASLPVLFYRFADGLYVVDATEETEDLIGSRVLAFGSLDADQVLAELAPVTHRDNPMTVEWLGVRFRLASLAFLRSIGVTDGGSRVRLAIESREGERRHVTLAGGPHARAFPRKLRSPPTVETAPPLWLRDVERNYWLEPLPERNALYFQFNQVRDMEDGPSIAAFSDSLRRTLERTQARTLIVDVRHNNGGNNGLLRPLVRTLVWWEQDADGREIFVVTGRNTFSAAQNFITRVERWTDAIFVGEPSSSSPNFAGEETNLLLPYSRVRGSISNRYWQDSDPDDDRPWIAPDIPVDLAAGDYFSGRDPALAAIFEVVERIGGR